MRYKYVRTCIKHNTLITRGPPCYLKPRFAALLARVFTPDTAHCVRASYRAQPEGAGGYFTLRIAREAATGHCALSGVLHITADGVHSAASGTCSPRPVHCMLQCYVQAPTQPLVTACCGGNKAWATATATIASNLMALPRRPIASRMPRFARSAGLHHYCLHFGSCTLAWGQRARPSLLLAEPLPPLTEGGRPVPAPSRAAIAIS